MAHDQRPKTYQLAALFLAISGLLHVSGGILNVFGAKTPAMIAIGALFLVGAYFLQAGRRWVAYIAFLFTIMSAAFSFIFFSGTKELPDLFYLCIIAANILSAMLLFYLIWRKKLATA